MERDRNTGREFVVTVWSKILGFELVDVRARHRRICCPAALVSHTRRDAMRRDAPSLDLTAFESVR